MSDSYPTQTLQYLRKVLANDDDELHEYQLNWLASVVQHPEKKMQIYRGEVSSMLPLRKILSALRRLSHPNNGGAWEQQVLLIVNNNNNQNEMDDFKKMVTEGWIAVEEKEKNNNWKVIVNDDDDANNGGDNVDDESLYQAIDQPEEAARFYQFLMARAIPTGWPHNVL